MIYSRILLFSAYIALSNFASAFQIEELEAGFYRYSPEIPSQQRNLIWDLEDAFLEQSDNNFRSISAVVNAGNGNIWAVINSELRLGVVDMTKTSILGSWPLKRWNQQNVTQEMKLRYKEFYRGDYPREKYNIKMLWAPGCFQNNPLRYGDIDEDGNKELVLFLGNDFVVFSPERERIVFAENLRLDDWLPKEETLRELESKFHSGPSPYQYLSGILSDTPDIEPGYRGYSKLYFGDFDDDGTPDILVWRKLYISRNSDDSIEGFKKLRDEWQHFKRNNVGEYMPQDTLMAQVQSWLQDNELTWQKGFPSKSECAGEEGELIPEMHDPLLNDPDVLQ